MTKNSLLNKIREGKMMTRSEMLSLTLLLSAPTMMAHLSDVIMQYIDASMVGSLGAEASASIGIVSTSIWLLVGLCTSATIGFSVQVAHDFGAKDYEEARSVLRQSLLVCLSFSLLLTIIGCCISPYLPIWLGGDEDIHHDASTYFFIFCSGLPFVMLRKISGSMLRCSGEMRIPAFINVLSCTLDVIFNILFIFKMHLGVLGAGLGTLAAQVISCIMMSYFLLVRHNELNIIEHKGSFRLKEVVLQKWIKIGGPIGIERIILCGAQIMTTILVAPLGTIAIAANSFGITIEALCYIPGRGIGEAATTLVGQSIGAKRIPLARSFGWITTLTGIAIMSIMGIIMYIFAPNIMSVMTPNFDVQMLTTQVLRIEAFAEPMYAAGIVAYGVFVGAGDTLTPCTINLVSIWLLRITLAALLAGTYGLSGIWIAMATELSIRGVIFLIRLKGNRWCIHKKGRI